MNTFVLWSANKVYHTKTNIFIPLYIRIHMLVHMYLKLLWFLKSIKYAMHELQNKLKAVREILLLIINYYYLFFILCFVRYILYYPSRKSYGLEDRH